VLASNFAVAELSPLATYLRFHGSPDKHGALPRCIKPAQPKPRQTLHHTSSIDLMSDFEKRFLASYPQTAGPDAPSGHPGHLDSTQEKSLRHLQELARAQGFVDRTDDATLLRFLRARKFEVQKAFDMFKDCEKWRKEYGTNTIIEDFDYPERQQVLAIYPKFYYKTDVDGRPVYYEMLGSVDVGKLQKVTTDERMLRDLVREYEAFIRYRLPAASREVGHLVETSCTILDLKNVSLSQAYHVYPFISQAAHIGQNYYPERMGKFYIINAPWGFSMIWSVIKKFLDPVTAEKIHILNYKYQSEILKQVPKQNLPVEFGGDSKTDGPIYLADDGPWKNPQFQGPEVEGQDAQAAAEPQPQA